MSIIQVPKKDYYLISEVARILGVGYHVIKHAVKTGKVKVKRTVVLKNKKVLIPYEEVVRLLKEKQEREKSL